MLITPDELYDIELEAYPQRLADYEAGITSGIPAFLLAKPEPPQIPRGPIWSRLKRYPRRK